MAGPPLHLHARRQVATVPEGDRFHSLTEEIVWQPEKTAIVICDMWDQHWCRSATSRVAEMAPRMNDVITEARDRGVLIVHCPSDTMKFYENAPQRKLAQGAPQVDPLPRKQFTHAATKEPVLPIDDSDGGCDCETPCKQHSPWKRQIATIQIADNDAITDSQEAYHLLRQRGIENVIVMGVHTNMCVLGRPFSIRKMVEQGMNVVLMRDLTDTMYNHRMPPKVSHFTGTDLVVGHIERNWCPTITSADFLGTPPFRFAADKRPHLVVLIAEDEYQTHRTLPDFGLAELGNDYRVSYVYENTMNHFDLPGIDVLADADGILVSVRRRVFPVEQMRAIREFVESGKPVIGIRTASHAFVLRDGTVPDGMAAWPEFDHDILGGNYTGHHGNKETTDPNTFCWVLEEAKNHPIVDGIPLGEFGVRSWLYKTRPLASSTKVLMMGRVEGQNRDADEPVAWTNINPHQGRVFYTSLGHPDDFQLESFRRLLVQGIQWAINPTQPVENSTGVPVKKGSGSK